MKQLKDEGTILDIGANIGIMSYHLSKQFPKSKIVAFEPMPDNLAVLERIVLKYELKNVTIEPLALSDKPGVLKMILPNNGKTKMQGLSHVKHESITEWNDGEEFEVKAVTLDELPLTSPVQGIKIDIENFEYFAFKGGKQLLERDHPVIYAELWENENRTLCFDLLAELNYQTYVVENNQLVAYNPTIHKKQNFIFKSN